MYMDFKYYHQPVLVNYLMAHFNITKDSIIVDGTLGFAGHASHILQAYPKLPYIGFDKDPFALNKAKERLALYTNVQTVHAPFSTLFNWTNDHNIKPTHILLDLGVSSFQIDQSSRGFTFLKDEPLDMRMNPNVGKNAAYILNNYTALELENILTHKAGIKQPERLIDHIVATRKRTPYTHTFQLVDTIKGAIRVSSRARFISECTRIFQAIRVEVNQEMGEIDQFLQVLKEQTGICVGVITFQPNEDRKLKTFLKENQIKLVTKKPLAATYHECKKNPRERTAKLRIFNV